MREDRIDINKYEKACVKLKHLKKPKQKGRQMSSQVQPAVGGIPQSPLATTASELQSSLFSIRDRLSDLTIRLQPMMAPSQPEAPSPEVACFDDSSEFVREMLTMHVVATDCHAALNNLFERLEI